MDCLVALLPSEIARLVYGYLLNEKCPKAAKSFLDESPNLQECRKVAYSGKPFTTRVSNWSLLDILDAFCQVNYIVQETADQFNRPDKLKHSNDLIGKVQFLLEIYACYQTTLEGGSPSTKNVQNPPSADKLPPENEQCTDDGSQNIPEKISQNLEEDSQRSVSPNSASCTEDETVSQDYPQTKEETQKRCLGHEEDAKSQDLRESPEKSHQRQPDHFQTDNCSQEIVKRSLSRNIVEDSKKYVDSEVQTSLALLQSSPHNSTTQKLHKCTQSEVKISEIEHCTGEKHAPTLENSGEKAKQLSDPNVQVGSTLTREKLNDGETDITQDKVKSLPGPKIISIENFSSQSLVTRYATNIGVSSSDNQMKLPSFRESFKHPRIIERRNQMQNVKASTLATNKNPEEIINKQDDQTKDEHGILRMNGETELSDGQGESRQLVDLSDGNLMTLANDIGNVPENLEKGMCFLKSPLNSQKFPLQSDGFFSHNSTLTSTPLKPLTHQNFDISNWFSTQINTPSTVQHKDTMSAGLDANCLYVQTMNKTAVTSSINSISPIIPTVTSQIGETTPKVVSTNVLQGPSLSLTKSGYSPGNSFPRIKNVKSPLFEKKTPLLQKNSREVDDLLNTPNVCKSSESAENPSSVSRNTSELNKILGLDSIMLYGMDNNATSLQIPLAIQEIEMEDSITFTGTGLSPFLKKLNSEKTDGVPDEKCNGKTEYTSSRTPNKCLPANVAAAVVGSCAINNSAVISQKKINVDDVIKYNTPQSLLENRTRNKRSSFTSPKKTNSCVRALDFDKNFQQCMSDGKAQDQERILSPTSMRRELMKSKACKTSLFQSPPYDNSNADDEKLNNVSNTEGVEIPLSTETSECAIETGKEKTALNDDVITKRRSSSKENDDNVVSHSPKKDVAGKKSWDSDLRKHLCIPEPPPSKRPNRKRNRKKPNQTTEQLSPPKKIRKSEKSGKKIGKNKKKASPGKEKDSNQEMINDEEDGEINESSEKSQPKEMGSTEKERDSLEVILSDRMNNDETVDEEPVRNIASKELKNLSKRNEIDMKNTSSEKDDSGIAEKMPLDEESLTTAFKKISDGLAAKYFSNQISEPASQIEKEQECPEVANVEPRESPASEDTVYAKIEKQLKEITGSGGNSQRQPIYDEVTQTSADGRLVQKKYARVRTLKPGEAPSTANCLLGLEDSPRKDEDSLQVPPTPRVLSPGSSMLVMPLSKHSEDSHTLASFVATTTLECPLTPGIVLTPPKPAPAVATSSLAAGLATASGASSRSKETDCSQPSLASFKASNSSKITNFGVIQENLLKSNKELVEPETISSTAYVPEEPVVYREVENVIKTDATSPTSSYCRSSCTASSCNSTSSSSEDENNNGSDSEEETQGVMAGENNTQDQEEEPEDEDAEVGSEVEQESGDRDGDSIDAQVLKKKRLKTGNINDSVSKIIEKAGEISPIKTLAIEKNTARIDKIEETPAKDDCQEAEIFETPNVAKSCENRTNLNDKISEMMIIKEREVALGDQNKLKPKIKNIEFDVPKIIVRPQSECPSKMQTRASSIKNTPGDTANQRIKFEKSEDEIAKAIESITVLEEEKIRQVQEDLEMSIDSCIESPSYKDDTSSKKELVRAIESITRADYGAEDFIDDSSGEAHPKLVLVDEGGDDPKENESKNDSFLNRSAEHCHNTRFKSRQKRNSNEGNSECTADDSNTKVYHIVYEDNEKRKKRRKGFSDSELVSNLYDSDGNPMILVSATKFEELFAIKPARKKPVRRAAKNSANSSDEDDDEDGVDDVENGTTGGCTSKDTNQTGVGRKRRVRNETVATKKKRQKSIYVY